jgi:hypothetical protein
MALNKTTLAADLLTAMNAACAVSASTPLQRRQALASAFADAIDTYIKDGNGVLLPGTLKTATNILIIESASVGSTVIKLQ